MTRAAYFAEIREAIRDGRIQEIPEYELLAVRQPVQIVVIWKTRVVMKRAGKIIRTSWRQYYGLVDYNPGDVLHPRWRKTTDWEREDWKDLPEGELKKLRVVKSDGEFSVRIIEKIEGLPAAVRQRTRHIPASLVARERKRFILAGNAQILADFAIRLNSLTNEFLATRRVSTQLMEKASEELARIYELLERGRTSLKRKALKDIQLALQGKFWEIPGRTIQVSAGLLNQRALDYEMAFKSIALGERWLRLMVESERRFRQCYNRLGELAMKLQASLRSAGKELSIAELRSTAREAYGIWIHLNREVHFNPYYQRLQAPEFQRLSRVQIHAEAGKAKTVLNSIRNAAAKLEAVAIGEKVTRAEVKREREVLF